MVSTARLLLLVLAGLLFAGCGSDSKTSFRGAVLHRPYHVPATGLTATDGSSFSLAADTGKRLTLVYFGYTQCPDECPTTMATIASALLRLDDADRSDVQVVFVTTDPGRDTRPVLRRWLDRFDPTFVGVTGDLATIKRVGEQVGVPLGHGRRLPSGGYDVTHGTQVLAVDGTDTVPVVWTAGVSPVELASDIHRLLA